MVSRSSHFILIPNTQGQVVSRQKVEQARKSHAELNRAGNEQAPLAVEPKGAARCPLLSGTLGQHPRPRAKEFAKFVGNFWELLQKCKFCTKEIHPAQSADQAMVASLKLTNIILRVENGIVHSPWCTLLNAGDYVTFPGPFLPCLLWHSIALAKCPVGPCCWLRTTGTASLLCPVDFPLALSSKVLSHWQGFFSPVSVRGANSAVVLILLEPEEIILFILFGLNVVC